MVVSSRKNISMCNIKLGLAAGDYAVLIKGNLPAFHPSSQGNIARFMLIAFSLLIWFVKISWSRDGGAERQHTQLNPP